MIRLNDLSKHLGDFILDGINLTVQDNEYFVILGPTGAGKTVLLETIAGMYQPDKGEIWINGCNVTSKCPEERNIGFVYQDYLLFPHLRVRDNILFGLKIRRLSQRAMKTALEQMVALLKIEHLLERYPDTLSGGEQQRVALARALITSPQVLLLDEPLSALDPPTREEFQAELKRIHQYARTTTIHITHDFDEAMVLADRVGIIRSGKLEQVGRPLDLFHKPRSREIARFVGMENIFPAVVRKYGQEKYVDLGSLRWRTLSELDGEVQVAIRPEDIILAREDFTSSAQNRVRGIVSAISPRGGMVKVTLDAGIPLVVLVTARAREEMELELGQELWAIFKATAVHVFK
ncbi:ABC transporter ATP-binding protein [Syntrophaceticus schinkii]|jgi:molybdopterin-binding protein|uniref:ABC-type quaternary amine transporter n=1 Tax=Syntrophaceticus schinkii TaxID=499207 RepID=A0A0B7MQJ4_9FIRM|nr:ABC transporter ATP-binding protein [Syntrophaceticus schinkii]CEO89982.1 Molybdate/tungstate import ATP-binding protein WtpC [Syntrophaceticus schinkii]